MLSLDSLIILLLIILIIYVYCNKYLKKEDFEVFFKPYYPITNDVSIKVNNYKGDVEDQRLDRLKEVLDAVKFNANDGENEYIVFNYMDKPVLKSVYNAQKVKPVTDFLMESISSNLPKGHNLAIKKLQEISKLEIEGEAKVTFKMICEYKINSKKNVKYTQQVHDDNDGNNDLVIDVEVLSIKKDDQEKLHLNNLTIMGIANKYLPGSNFYKNDEQYLFTNSLSNRIINFDSNNKKIEPEKNRKVSFEEDTLNDINTEDVESFFDI